MPDARFLHTEITLDLSNDGVLAEVAQQWLNLGLRTLFPDLLAAIERGSPDITPIITTMQGIDDPARSEPYSSARWGAALAGLAQRSRATTLDIFRGPSAQGDLLTSLSVDHLGATGKWVRLAINADVPESTLANSTECKKWVEVVHISLDHADPAFGLVTDDYRGMGHTTLDLALGRSRRTSLREARSRLRGYAWVTVCPGELVEKLGGSDQLRNSGAFHRVLPLAAGGAVLQSTEAAAQYDDAAMRKVFSTLSPVLPAGTPDLSHAPEGARLVYEAAG